MASPTSAPGPGTTFSTPARDAGLEGELAEADRAQRGADAGFRISVLPVASAGATFQAAIISG